MITPMKKVSILCLHEDTAATLDELRELGIIHVTRSKNPESERLDTQKTLLSNAEAALLSLNAHVHKPHHGIHDTGPVPDGSELIDQVLALTHHKNELSEKLEELRHERHVLRPYGNFDVAQIELLSREGITVKLYHVKDIDALDIPEDVQIHILAKEKTGGYIAAVATNSFDLKGTPPVLPDKSLETIKNEIASTKLAISDAETELLKLSQWHNTVSNIVHDLEESIHFIEVRDGMGESGRIAFLEGYCPLPRIPDIEKAAKAHGWGLLIEDPSEEDNVPTLLTVPKWIQPIKAVFDMLGIIPGYREADISAVFLLFFSIFFAILIGDAGYGLLFLVLTLIARKKLPKAPSYPFVLFSILSICTIVWGVVTGNYFGIQPDALPGFIQGLQLDWLTEGEESRDHIIKLCFLIGAVHLTIAHVWNSIVIFPSLKAIAQVGWIGLVWSMYCVALNMVLQIPYPPFFVPMFAIALILILLFMTSAKEMKKEWIHHAMFPLSVVNCFVDIVSYIRLFAVGLASLSVAQSFNGMAADLGWQKIWTIPLIAMILLLGHGLNILLCALGILVHGVRLNTLEFSLHKQIEWKGIPYSPFARKVKKEE